MFYFRYLILLAVLCCLGASALPAAAQTQPPSAQTPGPADSSDDKLSLSDQVVQDVLEPMRAGIETQNIKQVMSVFDKNEMSGWDDLQQQLHAFYRVYQQVNFRYQILQATAKEDHATATAEIDMDALPYQASLIAARRSVQARFQLKLESKGWRVVGFSPADLFSMSNWNSTDTR